MSDGYGFVLGIAWDSAVGWVIGAAIVVAAAKGWSCWYKEKRDER